MYALFYLKLNTPPLETVELLNPAIQLFPRMFAFYIVSKGVIAPMEVRQKLLNACKHKNYRPKWIAPVLVATIIVVTGNRLNAILMFVHIL